MTVFFFMCILVFPPCMAQRRFHSIPLPPRVFGAETVAFDCNGQGPYVGVSDGRIFKWNGRLSGWSEFATTSPIRPRLRCDGSTNPADESICGRPLGIKFNPITCELYIADAYFGLMKTQRTGGPAQQVATSAAGGPFRFLNGLEIDGRTGMVYFTDSSTIYQRRGWTTLVSSGDRTGRLLQYNPNTGRVEVLMSQIGFANGVALSRDGSFLLVGETTTSTIHRFWLRGPRARTSEVFRHLQAPPDGIKRNVNGDFWVAIHDNLVGGHVALRLNAQAAVVETLSGGPLLTAVSDVEEHNGAIWMGSVTNHHIGVLF